jgi:hypothetical protein
MSLVAGPVLVAGPPRTATSWTAKVLSHGGLVRYAREPIFQGKPLVYDDSLDNVFLEAGDEHQRLGAAWSDALSLRTRFVKRWLYAESSPIVRRIPLVPARLLVKEVNACLSLAWLERKFGFRIAVTFRHPCGFWASALKLRDMGHGTLNLNGLLTQERLMKAHFSGVRDWLTSLRDEEERLLAAYCMIVSVLERQCKQRPDWVLCRHEDLCADPQREFRRIFNALDFPFTKKAQRFIEDSTRESRGGTYGLSRNAALEAEKWKGELSSDRLRKAEEIMAKVGLANYPSVFGGPLS